MLEISLNSSEKLCASSQNIKIEYNKKYLLTTKVFGIFGEPYCAYFGVVIFDDNNNELSRKVQWLNDFTGNEKIFKIVFKAPNEASHINAIYRINDEVPIKSSCRFRLTPLEKINCDETKEQEIFEVPEDYSLPKPQSLSPDEEGILEKNLIWIFSSPRSGTSWLGTQLLGYRTKSLNEPYIGYHLGISEPKIHESVVRNFDLFKNDPDYFFSLKYKNIWKFYLRKLILERIFGQIQNINKPIIIKEPNGSLGADILSECLPKSKIIILLRDGRDVVDSWIDGLKKGAWFTVRYGFSSWNKKNKKHEITNQAKNWVRIIEILTKTYDRHPKDLRYMVKYENLRNNTTEELKKIYDFIGIRITDKELKKITEKFSFSNIPDAQKGSGKVTRSASPGRWQKNFNVGEKAILEEIMGETLRKLGY